MSQFEVLQSLLENLWAVFKCRPGSPVYIERSRHFSDLFYKSFHNGFINYSEYSELSESWNALLAAQYEEASARAQQTMDLAQQTLDRAKILREEALDVKSSPVEQRATEQDAPTKKRPTCRDVQLRFMLGKVAVHTKICQQRNLVVAKVPIESFLPTFAMLNVFNIRRNGAES
ncbi:MAG: hypothetical protein GXZ05_12025 [Gammaproteobacteria bacterium]|nr:hypothetical protein [Gammaproteobacteria bacterium]